MNKQKFRAAILEIWNDRCSRNVPLNEDYVAEILYDDNFDEIACTLYLKNFYVCQWQFAPQAKVVSGVIREMLNKMLV